MKSYEFDEKQLAKYLEQAIDIVDEDEHMGYVLDFVEQIANTMYRLRQTSDDGNVETTPITDEQKLEILREGDNAINWGVTCLGCSKDLDVSYAGWVKGHEAGLREAREITDEMREQVKEAITDVLREHYGYVPFPCGRQATEAALTAALRGEEES